MKTTNTPAARLALFAPAALVDDATLRTRSTRRAAISLGNNVTFHGFNLAPYANIDTAHFSATLFGARGVAALGFTVFALGSDEYVAVRTYSNEIASTNGSTISILVLA